MEIRPTNLHEVARDMESVFVGQMFAAMRSTLGDSKGMLAQSGPEKMFQQMLDQEIAKSVSQGQGLGIGDLLEKQLSGLEEIKK
jgi:flagellar protein FlgJ